VTRVTDVTVAIKAVTKSVDMALAIQAELERAGFKVIRAPKRREERVK
jgi:hypothetical protein